MKPRANKSHHPKIHNPHLESNTRSRWIYLVFILIAFVLYGNSLSNRYAVDDMYAITGNKYTQQGIAGIPALLTKDFFSGYYGDQEIQLSGGRYRPFSLVTFAIEQELFSEQPHVSHFFNVALFALSACLLFSFLLMLLKTKGNNPWYLSIPLVATLLFLAHPIHTEVVANIKGRDEILSLLGSLTAGIYYLRYIKSPRFKYLIYSFLYFFIAVMSKENAFLFLLFIPLAVYFFKDFNRRKNLYAFLPLLLAGLLFIAIRTAVLGGFSPHPSTELLDNPFVQAGFFQRYATILYVLGMYLKLLFLPHPLTWDYYPYHIGLTDFTDVWVWISGLIYSILLVMAIAGTMKKKGYAYSLWFYLVSLFLVSNIVFQIGTFMAERFLYLPSVAFCLIMAWLLTDKLHPFLQKYGTSTLKMVPGFLILILTLYSLRTISRNPDWKDDYTLYTHDAEISVNSAKSNNVAGQWYAWAANQPSNVTHRNELFTKSLRMLTKAVTIHPTYQDAWFHLGNVYYDFSKNIDSTLYCYSQILRQNPNEDNVFRNLELILGQVKDPAKAIQYWESIRVLSPERFEPNQRLAYLYASSQPVLSLERMEAACVSRPANPEVLRFLGDGYYRIKNYSLSRKYWEECLKQRPGDSTLIRNLQALRQESQP